MTGLRLFFFLILISPLQLFPQSIKKQTEVLVVGGGVGGTAAAIQAARLGVKTILVEPTTMLGGMLTAAGVSCTDGNNFLPGGMWEEFREALHAHYKLKWLNTGWVSYTNFEPHVADSIFKAWASQEKNLEVWFGYELSGVEKNGNKIAAADFSKKGSKTDLKIRADVFVDATELGDLFAAAGAAYDLGMDDPAASGEKEARQKNNIIQDITWAATLKDYGKNADKTIPKPPNYDPKKYYCCCTDAPCDAKSWNGDKWKMLNYGKLPKSPGATLDKYMLNWPAHGNDFYLNVVDSNYTSRLAGYELAKQHTLGFIYFIQTELGFKNISLVDDELDGGLAFIPYNREGRRVRGLVRMNIDHIKNPYNYTLYRTGISVGDYPVDHHHAQYPGKVPELEFPQIPSYNIPLGALIPEKIENLVVCEKGISVTNIVNGTTRLQPVVMLTGQAAGVLAALSQKLKLKIKNVPVREVQQKLLELKCLLMPFVDVKPDDPAWEAIQKVGVTGILKGAGKPEGWANKMFFYPDSSVKQYFELTSGISRYFSLIRRNYHDTTIGEICKFLIRLTPKIKQPAFIKVKNMEDFRSLWGQWGLKNFDLKRAMTRREAAVVLNNTILLFGSKNFVLDLDGNMNFKYSSF